MTLSEALDIVVARTGVERYRFLCLEHANPKVREEYGQLIMRLATEPAGVQRMPTQESIRLIAAMKACQFRSPCKTGCGSGYCGLKSGRQVSHAECFTCIKTYG